MSHNLAGENIRMRALHSATLGTSLIYQSLPIWVHILSLFDLILLGFYCLISYICCCCYLQCCYAYVFTLYYSFKFIVYASLNATIISRDFVFFLVILLGFRKLEPITMPPCCIKSQTTACKITCQPNNLSSQINEFPNVKIHSRKRL